MQALYLRDKGFQKMTGLVKNLGNTNKNNLPRWFHESIFPRSEISQEWNRREFKFGLYWKGSWAGSRRLIWVTSNTSWHSGLFQKHPPHPILDKLHQNWYKYTRIEKSTTSRYIIVSRIITKLNYLSANTANISFYLLKHLQWGNYIRTVH